MSVKPDCIEMSVGGLTLDPVTKTPIVILKDTENKLNLPIWIGLLEATAMATEIEGIAMARPMTHDLLKTLLAEVGGTVQSIEITELKENTYYAAIHLSLAGGRQVMLDSRPSDAIALALRAKCPIYVAKAVLEASSVLQQDENKETPVENVSNVSQEKWGEILEKMTPDDFKYKQ
ncbi:MAG TPA: bifunctional nuclease family protein [Candidatus Binatia bacterium]